MAALTITCTVTNDLNYDQRMIRICSSLATAGYDVCLIGRKRKSSPPLQEKPFRQKRLYCFFEQGKLFYIEYNIRLFFFLLFVKTDCYCAIDLDTILPNWLASVLRRKKSVYDAHELFCEMDEITSRPAVYKIWKSIERFAVPKFPNGYTIGYYYAQEFRNMYQVSYEIVRNASVLNPTSLLHGRNDAYILYQGAVNEGRCFESLIPAMQYVNAKLIVCGKGNFYEQAIALCKSHGLEEKIQFEGYVEPTRLKDYTQKATIGITLFTAKGKSNYLSMANRFFDYMHAGVPQLCMDFPEYRQVNAQYEIARLIQDTSPESIAEALNTMLKDKMYLERLRQNCIEARRVYCWQEEEKKLLAFYHSLFEEK